MARISDDPADRPRLALVAQLNADELGEATYNPDPPRVLRLTRLLRGAV